MKTAAVGALLLVLWRWDAAVLARLLPLLVVVPTCCCCRWRPPAAAAAAGTHVLRPTPTLLCSRVHRPGRRQRAGGVRDDGGGGKGRARPTVPHTAQGRRAHIPRLRLQVRWMGWVERRHEAGEVGAYQLGRRRCCGQQQEPAGGRSASPQALPLPLRSYLGYGLMAARAAVLSEEAPEGHPCVPAGHSGTYEYAGKTMDMRPHPVGGGGCRRELLAWFGGAGTGRCAARVCCCLARGRPPAHSLPLRPRLLPAPRTARPWTAARPWCCRR